MSLGAYDRAEVCKLMGPFMSSLLSKKGNNFGLYHDDDWPFKKLKVNRNQNRYRKTSRNYLRNMKIVNYLDVTFI